MDIKCFIINLPKHKERHTHMTNTNYDHRIWSKIGYNVGTYWDHCPDLHYDHSFKL